MSASSVHRVVAALARGILGESYVPEVPHRIVDLLDRLPSEAARKQVTTVLRALDTRPGALAFTGRPIPVSWFTATEAERVVQKWRSSRLKSQRELAAAMLSSSLVALYGYASPEWERIGYPGPLHPPTDVPKTIKTLEVDEDVHLRCDVVIVGSGAGGGCVAGHLAKEGLDVVVIEKGGYRNESDFSQVEGEAHKDMWLYAGTLTTSDTGIRIFAGSTLGGGTVINWSSSWKTPKLVLEEWARVSGIDAFANGEIEDSLDEVCERLSVNHDSSAAGKRDELLEEGAKRLGWHVDQFPRNVKGCTQDEACGFCTFGCRIGAKQSALLTYLQDAGDNGARVLTNADVRKVVVSDGRATGVEAICGPYKVRVEARTVVVAGGSIETPALLLRSGIKGRVGHNLRLHPATAVSGIFEEEVRYWGGVMQARYSGELLDGPIGSYGPTLESGPGHPGSIAGVLPWSDSRRHRELMERYPYMSAVGFPLRERGSGRVKIDRTGAPKVEYRLSTEDERRFGDGVLGAAKVLEAAGATEIFTWHHDPISYAPGSPGAHERWAEETRARGYAHGEIAIFTMHQMGTCAMGTDPSSSVVGPDNESHQVTNLFVVDASTFPTPSGVNPMISIYGIANRAAKKIAARLG